MQQTYGAPPGAQGHAGYPSPQAGPSAKPIDGTRLVVAIAGFALMALHHITILLVDRIESQAGALVLALLHAVGLCAAGIGLTGLRSTPAFLCAAANGISAITLLGFQALQLLEVESIFIYKFYFVALDGWLAAAALTTAVTMFANARKLGPAAFAAGGLWAIATLVEARFFFAAVAQLLKQPIDYSPTWRTASLVCLVLASVGGAVACLLGKLRPSPAG